MKQIAGELEEDAKKGEIENATDLLTHVQAAYEQAWPALKELQKQRDNKDKGDDGK